MENQNQNSNEPTREEMAFVQALHLNILEEIGKKSHRVFEVPIVQALTYNTIQVLNNLYLSDELGTNGEIEEENISIEDKEVK
jgi:hypothetical protein